jgi:hypothetical protein
MRIIQGLIMLLWTIVLINCAKEPDSSIPTDETGLISFRISNPLFYKNTAKISYVLSRKNYNPITETILISSSDEKLNFLITNVPSGLWNLEVIALDESNQVCYSESHEIKVVENEIITVDLKWGNNAGKAAYFNGGVNYINIESTATLNMISDAVTIEAWVKPLYRYYNTVIAKGSSNFLVQLVTLRPGLILRGLDIDYSGSENYWDRILLYEYVPEDSWTHIACTYSKYDQLVTIYLNGIIKHQCSASGNINSSGDDIRIGSRISDAFPEYFFGSIDEIRIWNVTRSQSEIRNCMTKELSGDENGLIGYWNFNRTIDQTIILDNSPYNHNGVIIGIVELVDSYAF